MLRAWLAASAAVLLDRIAGPLFGQIRRLGTTTTRGDIGAFRQSEKSGRSIRAHAPGGDERAMFSAQPLTLADKLGALARQKFFQLAAHQFRPVISQGRDGDLVDRYNDLVARVHA